MLRPLLLLALAFPTLSSAQLLCGPEGIDIKITPAQPAVGEKISVTILNQTLQKIEFQDNCVFRSVHMDDCSGPIVYKPICLPVLTPLGPGDSLTTDWDPLLGPGPAPLAGTFAFMISYVDGAGNLVKCCPTVDVGGGPPACGSFQLYGTGCAGSSGVAPKLTGDGCPAASGDISISSVGGPPSSPAFLAIGLGTDPLPVSPTCIASIAPWLGGLIPTSYSPAGTFDLNLTLPAGFPVVKISMQALGVDIGFPPDFLVLSNGLQMKTL